MYMKKGILLLVALLSFGFFGEAQTITKQDAKKISREINKNVQMLEKAIDRTDWKQVERVLDKTATSIEKNTDGLAMIMENIDVAPFLKTMGKLASQLENSVDTKELERTMDKISKRMETVVKKIIAESMQSR